MKKKMFTLIFIVVALVSVNAALVSADAGSTGTDKIASGGIVPLRHGVDH
ncbi:MULTISPECIES: hypothetical protein [Paenibacillus]|nr:hypothetical protein [Paenibacillus borealis]